MSHSAPSPTPHRCASSSEGSGPRPALQLALFASYSYHAFITDREGDTLGTGSRPSPTRRDRERHPRPEVRCGTEPSALGALCRQRRLDGRAGDGSQSGPLDRPHRSGGAGGDHQDPQTALLRPGRTTYTLGAPSHSCISRRAGPGGTCSVEPWRDCAPCHPLSDGGAGKRYANLILINRPDQGLLNSRRMDRRRFPTASGPSVGAPHPCRWIASGLSEAPSTRNPPCPSRPPFHSVPLQHCHNMLRWIRA